ncbi:MAG: GNAT family N-acetyltransferase [Planctomycetota bacterium]|nr:GNAT family N-acetyltransferase [Planctomycetota bacterium]
MKRDEWQLDENETLRRVGPDDAPAVIDLVQATARWVEDVKGVRQWRLYLTEPGVRSIHARLAGNGGAETYLALRGDIPAGAFAIQYADPECWGRRGEDGLAGYVHMLSVAPEFHGLRLGERMLRWAEQRIASNKRAFARLDCWAGSPALCAYYPRLGYTRLSPDEQRLSDLAWFEKRVLP